jgi:hypothetical protein
MLFPLCNNDVPTAVISVHEKVNVFYGAEWSELTEITNGRDNRRYHRVWRSGSHEWEML